MSKPRYSAPACQSAQVACSPSAPIRRQAAFTAGLVTGRFGRYDALRAREGGVINAFGEVCAREDDAGVPCVYMITWSSSRRGADVFHSGVK